MLHRAFVQRFFATFPVLVILAIALLSASQASFWLKKGEPTQFLMGLDLLDCADFWGLDLASQKKRD